jgi:hypothetical protein
MRFHLILFTAIAFAVTTSCTPSYSKFVSGYTHTSSVAKPDYTDLFYWAAHPDKRDPSDSIPAPLRESWQFDTTADVFFLHPTTLTDLSDPRANADIDDAALNAKTDYSTILYQASAFNHYRLFAPRYRQAHIRWYFTGDTAAAMAAFDTAYSDIAAAFRYYLDHYNHGRPIIIASHSQGSTHAQRLLSEFFDGKSLQQQLVAAYVIGMYIPANRYLSLKACSDSTQTGCILGWRTYKAGYLPEFVIKEHNSGIITNPLTGGPVPEPIPHTANLGSVLTKFNEVHSELVGAEIHEGILWIDRLHMTGGRLYRRKNFHVGDINLFYVNIQRDLNGRVRHFGSSK